MTKPLPKRPTVAEFLTDRIASIDKTQIQISEESGFEHPNIISMLKGGQTKLPINRVFLLAKALEVEPAYLLRIAMMEYMQEEWECIEMLRAFRESTGDVNACALVIDTRSTVAIVIA
jgi:transcriptional regulator with XRE-family HTH domain